MHSSTVYIVYSSSIVVYDKFVRHCFNLFGFFVLLFISFDFNYGSRWFHLAFNLIVQLLVGLPLEMVHGSTRIGCVYLAGVLAGSMGTSVFDPEVYLVGASGGVYALLAAHLANVMLNYNNMHYGIIRIVGIFLFGKLNSFDYNFFLQYAYIEYPKESSAFRFEKCR